MSSNHLKINYTPPHTLACHIRQLRTPSKNQAQKSKRFLEQFGFIMPVAIDADNIIIIGELFVNASFDLSYDAIPTVRVEHLSEADVKALRIAYDRIMEESEWNKEALKLEFQELQILLPDIDLTMTGFEIPEIDMILNFDPVEEDDPLDIIPEIDEENTITQLGDLYQLGDHLLLCGDSLDEDSYKTLLGDDKAQMVFTDAPYNVKIDGHVGNSGEIQHREFKMASGEMSVDEFTVFLTRAHHHMVNACSDGAILFSCMDWRHMGEMLAAANKNKLELKNLCVWTKDNGGMGSLYRSQHELVFVFKKGTAPHINNVELGKHGRYRTNVWQYPGVNSFGNNRMDELKLHPTVKPTQMIVDAILDCSNPKGIILDVFGGSGTTLIAAEKTGRRARLIELDPVYCDVIIKRFEEMTGIKAIKLNTLKTNAKEA